jgi:dolichol-phosphate mannosyltransferase
MSYLSIVIPVYNCSKALDELIYRLHNTLKEITDDYEIIFVNDASPENDWELIKEFSKKDLRVKGINLSRNFGQHYAITAGLQFVSGLWIVVMDGDLQDQPEFILNLYNKTKEGFDVVFAKRQKRKDSFIKRVTSKMFYRLFDYFTGNSSDNSVSNFGIYSKKVILNYNRFKEKYRIFPLIIKWLGFPTAYINVEHAPRVYGKSSYNYSKLFNLAIDVILSHSNKPLRLSIKFGLFLSFCSFLYLLYLIVRYLYLDVPLGWTSIMVSIFFIGGLLFANLGLIGLYIGKIFDETKDQPIFIVKDLVGRFKNIKNEELYKQD